MTIKKIFHISDIHIRNGDIIYSRYEEYKTVFNNLFNSLNNDIINLKLRKEEYLIILTGDIFHNKNNIGNYGLMLYKILIENLTKIGLTIIFEGNHDSVQHELNQPSLVTSTIGIDNLIVLKETKSFIIDNIGFSYVSIRDTLDNFSNTGRKLNLKPFPEIEKKVKYKIALFHGTFANIKLYNGTNIGSESNPYPFEWIKDFDYALLGDIHLRQKGNYKSGLIWCYSGSLIQQNFGEDIIEHGYVIWNLEEKEIYERNVLNNKGKIILKEIEEKIYLRKTNKFYDLEKYIEENFNLFPKNLEIKFLSSFNYENFDKIMNKYKINYNIINNVNNNIDIKTNNIFNNCFNNYNEIDKENMIIYFEKHLEKEQYIKLLDIFKDYDKLLFNIEEYPKELEEDCLKKNKELSILINNCRLSEDNVNNKNNFIIKYIEWNNLFCYSSKNWINFNNLSNSSFIISGKNGIGKSAIYDIIILAIWGEITKNKQNEITSGIINYNSDIGSTIIDIYSNNETYRIKRIFKKRQDNPLLIKINTYLYHNNNNDFILIKKDTACKEYINNIFGTIDIFLSSSMITQNIDYDILKMNYKECTELIDKATNIQYIYNLYNLFKNVLNKYKDFNKITTSKKNVYKELVNNFSNKYDNNYIKECKSKLDILNKNKINLINILNSLSVSIDKEIIFINYDILIEKLGKININTIEEYNLLLDEFNELKYFFKNNNIDDDEINNNYEIYDSNIHINNDNIIEKPCDLLILENEKKELENYNDFINLYPDNNIKELDNILINNKSIYSKLELELNNINNIKPNYIEKPLYNYNEIIDKINYIFNNNINDFIKFYNKNPKLNLNNNIDIFDNITYNIIKNNIKKEKILLNRISNNEKKLIDIDNNIKNYMLELNKFDCIIKPDINIKFKNSKTVLKNIEKFKNIDDLITYNNTNNELINNYNIKINEITDIENKISILNNELLLLNNNDEYKYDPNCIYCCNRPWVIKIKELNLNILKLKNNIDLINIDIKNNFKNINNIIKEYDNNNIIINKYNLYNKWYNYYLYIEIKSKLEINIKSYDNIKIFLENDKKELDKLKYIFDNFLNLSYNLYNIYNDFNNYFKYIDWLDKYNLINNKINNIKNEIDNLNKHIYYFNNIKPRIDNYNNLNSKYLNWKKNNYNKKIYNSYKYIKLKKNIEKYKLYLNYIDNKNKQSEMLKKIKINENINLIDNDINNINLIINEYNTTNTINNDNLDAFNKLITIENNINNVINIINIIIDKFKDYRKWLYNNYILKNIIYNTNNFIKSLCHNDTKKFELDYILTDNKDIIHINWLIKNIDDNNNKQTISINQASGFQHFVISIALRLSLFNNKHCSQLFIDEGFTACDKNNLSIVPDFLKNLLKIFNTIIIVSHLDLIQDSIDEKIEIKFNNNNKSSSLNYGDYILL